MTAQELKERRAQIGYSQEELAKALGVHAVTVARWETNARAIPPFLTLALKTLEREKVASKPKSK